MLLRPATVFAMVLLLLAAFVLFKVKYKVQNLDRELAEAERQLILEKNHIHVLKAEWAYLSRPERIKYLAESYLVLEHVQVSQLQDDKALVDAATKLSSIDSHVNQIAYIVQ